MMPNMPMAVSHGVDGIHMLLAPSIQSCHLPAIASFLTAIAGLCDARRGIWDVETVRRSVGARQFAAFHVTINKFVFGHGNGSYFLCFGQPG
jgi:hypothetical protein